MFQLDMVQIGMVQGGGQLFPRTSVTDSAQTGTLFVKAADNPRVTARIDDIDWGTVGKTVTLRIYRTIGGLRSLYSEGIVDTGPTTVKGVQQIGKKPMIAMPMHEDCDLDVEVIVSGALPLSVDVEL